MAPRPEAASTPVRTPIEFEDETNKKENEQHENWTLPKELEEVQGRTSEACKLTKRPSSKIKRQQRCNYRVPAPDGGWGWMVLLGVVLGNILIIGHAKTFGVYIPIFIEMFDEKPSTVAWIQSIQFSFFLGFAPISSMLAERFSPRAVTLVGALLACLGMGVSSLATSLTHLYFSYGILMGLASVFTFTPGVMMIAKYFDKRRGLANGLGMAGNSLGGIFMPILADFLISEYSLHGGLLIMGGVLLNAAVGAMLWRPVESLKIPGGSRRLAGQSIRSSANRPGSGHVKGQTQITTKNSTNHLDISIFPQVTEAKINNESTPFMFEENHEKIPAENLQNDSKDKLDITLGDGQIPGAPSVTSVSPCPVLWGTGGDVTTVEGTLDASSGENRSIQAANSPPRNNSSICSQSKKDSHSESVQRGLDHTSIFSTSTASLTSSFVYLSTFHLGPSYGTVDDITNLAYDDEEEEESVEVGDEESSDDGYDVYETVRARSDLKIDIAGLLGGDEARKVALKEKDARVANVEESTLEQKNMTDAVATVEATAGLIAPKGRPSTKGVTERKNSLQKVAVKKNLKKPQPIKTKYFDFSFFKSYVFYVMMVPLFLHNIGYPTIQMYTPMYARSLGFSPSNSARCLSFLAFADVIGRIGCAWISDLHLCARKYYYMAGMCISGLVAFSFPFARSYHQLLLCTSGFGLASGAYIGLTVALFADAFGTENVAKAHSMATMCSGIAGLAAGPVIGYILEKTNSFMVCYGILGACQILGSLVYLLEPWAARREINKLKLQQWV